MMLMAKNAVLIQNLWTASTLHRFHDKWIQVVVMFFRQVIKNNAVPFCPRNLFFRSAISAVVSQVLGQIGVLRTNRVHISRNYARKTVWVGCLNFSICFYRIGFIFHSFAITWRRFPVAFPTSLCVSGSRSSNGHVLCSHLLLTKRPHFRNPNPSARETVHLQWYLPWK